MFMSEHLKKALWSQTLYLPHPLVTESFESQSSHPEKRGSDEMFFTKLNKAAHS